MNIKELAEKYELQKEDFWELRKNSGKWIITHDACEKIAVTEGIIFEEPEFHYNVPTIITENGEKVTKVVYGKEKFTPAWAGTCQKKTGAVSMKVSGYKLDNPDYKIWTIGEADASNCTSTYYGAMSEKRGKDRVILKLINAYEYGIYSDVEADDFEDHDKPATEKQIDMLHNLATELDTRLLGVDKMNKEEVSALIDELKEEQLTKKAEDMAKEKEQKHGV
tara:strand:+ start:1043 stop:1708 length:666 start_codon:yes stop_codon:yes gene_type:complete